MQYSRLAQAMRQGRLNPARVCDALVSANPGPQALPLAMAIMQEGDAATRALMQPVCVNYARQLTFRNHRASVPPVPPINE